MSTVSHNQSGFLGNSDAHNLIGSLIGYKNSYENAVFVWVCIR